jgi:putative ABC transport system permease protein
MRFLHRAVALIRALFRSARVDADLADELRFHIERETESNVARGMPTDAACRAARLKFGSVDDVLERAREDRPGASLRQALRDIRFGGRLLVKSPVFGLAGVTIVALGIGAVTAIFSVVYGVMLRPLPFREPERLVSIWSRAPSLDLTRLYPTAADAAEWRKSNRVFEDIALVRTTANLNLVGDGEPERLQGARLSPNLFSVLGVSAALGRTFALDENQPGRDQVVLLSHGLWQRRFAGDRAIVGRRIQLNGLPHTVIGVMPPDFQYPSREFQAWVPVVVDPLELTRQETQNYLVVARLERGVTLAQAQGDLETIAKRLETQYPATNRGRGVVVEPMLESAVRDVRPALIVLLAASSCLLLIACLNLSNLLGARAAARGGEFAVRLALGASRPRLVAQAIAEVTPLLAIGGLLGVAAATFGVRAFVAFAPPNVPRLESISVSMPVIFVSLAILVATGVVATVVPAVHAWRADFTKMTKDGGRSSTSGRRRADARRAGVAVQIAFAVPLLVGASLLIRSSLKLAQVDLGFRPEHVATFHLAVPRTKYPSDAQVAAFYDRLLQTVRAVPGVAQAGLVNRLPLAGNQTVSIHVERSPGTIVDVSSIDSRPVTPSYFASLGIAMRGGRSFTERDDATAPAVAIVDDRIARAMWPGENAVGKRIQRFDFVWCTVVGVVGHIHANGVDVDPRPQVYWSYRQVTQDRMVLVVRSYGEPGAIVTPIMQAIRMLDPEQPVYDVRTMNAVVDRSLVQRRLTMVLIVAFGAIALVLAAVGVYGVVAYGVTQRLREFGIRVALGATRRDVSRLVVREGTSMALIGLLFGLVGAAALSGAMSNLVFGVTPRDVASLAAGTLTLLLVAVIASYIPARRASGVDPAVTLRAE